MTILRKAECRPVLVDRLEKIARIILWLTIAALLLIVPVGLARQAEAEQAAAREAAEALAAAKAAEAPSGPQRLLFATMGAAMTSLRAAEAFGAVWLTNVSPRSGFLCVQGTATGDGGTAKSLPACTEVSPYESAVKIDFMFAGSDMAAACKGASPCRLNVEDAPDAEPR